MTRNPSQRQRGTRRSSSSPLTFAAVLGLSRLSADQRESLSRSQLKAIDKLPALRSMFAAAAILLVCGLFFNIAPNLVLLGWMAVAAAGLTASGSVRLFGRNGADRDLPARAVGLFRIELVSQALIWAAPMLVLAPYAGREELAALWTLNTCIMAAVAVAFHAVALSACAFLLILGGASVLAMLNADSPVLAAAAAMFTIVVAGACLRQAQQFGRQVTLDTQLADNRETVSMLLREFDASGADWLWQTDASRRLEGVSPTFARAMRLEAVAIEGQSFLEILAGRTWATGNFDPAIQTLAARLKDRVAFANLIMPVEIEGERRWWQLSGTPRIDDRATFLGFRGVASDVTAEQEANARIEQLARYDLLTKLPNRLCLTEALGEAVDGMTRWNTRCAFLMIDLDRFKSVNDTLGHQIGDLLLAQVAERLRAVCSENEICGRLGGDEFAVVVRDVPNRDYVHRIASMVIKSISKPYEVNGHMLYISGSIGSATAPRDGTTPDPLIRNADLAMYRAKDGGGGKHFAYVPSLHADAEERRVMEMALRNAMANGEFHLEYQPVVDAKTGELISFESLLRWVNPRLGLVSPAKFIPLAEESRMIGQIGDWVMRTTCKEAAGWPAHVGVALNISAEQLYDPQITARIASALGASTIAPDRVEMEVTESVFLRESSELARTLESILSLGVRLALDDFGTGFSSLGYLTRSRFKTIKIDRGFVQGAARGEPECLAIVNAVVALSNSLGIGTTAEGVETEQQLDVVRALGCTKVQGFYFGRPMKVDAVHQLFRDLRLQVA